MFTEARERSCRILATLWKYREAPMEESIMSSDLRTVTQMVLNRAKAQGYVVAREIREELEHAGQPATRWKDVVREAGESLSLSHGRYHYVSRIRVRMREDHRQLKRVKGAARDLIRKYKRGSAERERRSFRRIHFIIPVKAQLPNGKEITLVSQDISLTGVRLLGTADLLGQKIRLFMPSIDHGGGQWCFLVHVLWSSQVADGMIENGGIFLEVQEIS
jgi:hypothetical protein